MLGLIAAVLSCRAAEDIEISIREIAPLSAQSFLEFEGDLAFAMSSTYLQTFSAGEPPTMARLGQLQIPRFATPNWDADVTSLDAVGSRVFLACGKDGLRIVDAADPSIPVLRGRWDNPDRALAVRAVENYAFVADGASGLQVIDVSNSDAPTLAATYQTSPRSATGLALIDNEKLLLILGERFEILDIRNPGAPRLLGGSSLFDVRVLRSFCVVGNTCYFTVLYHTGFYGIDSYDISQPSSPRRVLNNYVPPGQPFVSGGTYLVGLSRELLYAGGTILNVSSPASPVHVATVAGITLPRARNAEILAVATGGAGTVLASVTLAPASQPRAGSIPNVIRYPVFSGDKAFCSMDGSVRLVDFTSLPSETIRVFPASATGQIAADENLLCVPSNYRELLVFDSRNAASPPGAYRVGDNQSVDNVAVKGTIAYISTSLGLDVVDLSDRQGPLRIDRFVNSEMEYYSARVDLAGDHAYWGQLLLAFDSEGFPYYSHARIRILDAANPRDPRQVGVFSFSPYGQYGFFFKDGYAYLRGRNSLLIADFRDPANPRAISGLTLPIDGDPFVHEGFAYLPAGALGMHVVDVRVPAAPRIVARNNTVIGRNAFAAADRLFLGSDTETFLLNRYPDVRLTATADDQTLQLQLRGPTGASGQIQWTEDFLNWSNPEPILFNGPTEVRKSDAASARRFYRFVASP